jgi:hypothetical protein
MTRRSSTTLLALTALAVAGPAAQAADAKPKTKPYKGAVYELQLKGSEAATWHYEAPADGCFYGAVGNGSQSAIYKTGKVKVKLVRPKSGDRQGLLQFATVKDTLTELGYSTGIEGVVEIEREGDIQSSAGCGGTGGSTQQPPPKDCGVRYGRVVLQPGFHALTAFSVGGDYDHFGTPAEGDTDEIVPPVGPPRDGQHLDATYKNCPILLPSGFDVRTRLTTVGKQLSQRRLARLRKGKTLKLSGGDRDTFADEDGQRTAETSVAWTLRLKRIK